MVARAPGGGDHAADLHVREFVQRLCARGVSAHVVHRSRAVLSAIFTTALRDQVIAQHPCAGIRGPVVPSKPVRILEPGELDRLLAVLPGGVLAGAVELAVESGVRWGELVELRAGIWTRAPAC